jgi:hypothetical protein
MFIADIAPARYAETVVPGTPFTKTCIGIYVGTGGDVAVVMAGDGTTKVHKNVPNGGLLVVSATQVAVSGTTATDMLAYRNL